jgi:predicted aspartyl protease
MKLKSAIGCAAALAALLLGTGRIADAFNSPELKTQDASAVPDAADALAEILVEAREPRYVAPTRRDQIGRIWAPVFINGRGPFRLVLDTGASHSAITAMVALALGIPTDQSPPVTLRGVTGGD